MDTTNSSSRSLRKVPVVTALFWTIKVLTTALGESTSDYLIHIMAPSIAVVLGAFALLIALVIQFGVRRYIPWVYWLTVAMVAIFGTMAADVLHVGLGIPYLVTTTFFAVVLAIVFVVWQRTEKTLSIHSITTPRREAFYWATVMSTFALGTAAGDMTANTLGLGYFASAVLFAILIAIPALGYWKFHLNTILAFWAAYVLTRPLGASLADWLGKPPASSGLGFGDGLVSLILAIIAASLVGYLSVKRGRS